jgi:REP element-mobilizing transposase RayT
MQETMGSERNGNTTAAHKPAVTGPVSGKETMGSKRNGNTTAMHKPAAPGPVSGGTGLCPVREELRITRRNLPHWQIGGSTYFITFRTNDLVLPAEARRMVIDACRHLDAKRYTLWAAVAMPDHVHLLLQPTETDPGRWWPLATIMNSIKGFTARQINGLLGRRGAVWLDERFDRIVRDEAELMEKWNYIRMNPVKKGLCERPEEWDALYERAN